MKYVSWKYEVCIMEAHRFTNININFILEKHHRHHKRLHTARHKSKPCKYTIYDIISIKICNYKTITSDLKLFL